MNRIVLRALTSVAMIAMMVALLALPSATALAEVNVVTPSTNDANRTNGWAHFNVVDVGIGEATVEFVSTRGFASCFEYRADGDTNQVISSNGGVNYNPSITDGLYPFFCLNNNTRIETLHANEYIEIRMVFGAETDERFDWTRVDVLPDAQTKEDCKDGGWETYGFRNQGLCIQFVNTGIDSRE